MFSLQSFKYFLKCNPYIATFNEMFPLQHLLYILPFKICLWNLLVQYHLQIVHIVRLIPLSFFRVMKKMTSQCEMTQIK